MASHFPVFEEDVFLKFRPFPAEPANFFEAHWHEIAASFLFYNAVQWLSPRVSSALLGTKYTALPLKTRINFDIHVVSQVQCIVSILAIVPCWNHPYILNRAVDPQHSILGYYPYGGLVLGISTGYFMWDTYVCAKYYRLFGAGFLLHGVAALYVFGTSFLPFLIPWIPSFLLFELSTPFVNMNWFASKLPKGTFSQKFVIVNGLLLMAVFFSVRILWGFYAVGLLAWDMYRIRHQVHPFWPVMVLSLNALLDVLNVFWFCKMVLIAKKTTLSKRD